METDTSAAPSDFSKRIRKRARMRSHFLPGFGFALLGYSALAVVGAAVVALNPLTFVYFSVVFSALAMMAVIAAMLLYLIFYLVEQLASRFITIHPEGEKSFLTRLFLPICVVGYLGLAGSICVLFINISSIKIGGQGMSPTALPGEYLLYRKHLYHDDLSSGHLVFFKTSSDSAWGKGGDLIIARILAVPGDELSIENGHYLINGRQTSSLTPLRRYRPVIDVPESPKAIVVPSGCYFIVQDDTSNALDSRVLSWARESDIIGTRAILLNSRAFGKELK